MTMPEDPGGGAQPAPPADPSAAAQIDLTGVGGFLQSLLSTHITEMRSLTDNMNKTIESQFSTFKSMSEQFATKQDTHVDEEMGGQRGTSGANNVAISNLVNNAYANMANLLGLGAATSRAQLDATVNMHIAGTAFTAQLVQTIAALEAQQQHGANARNRGMVKGKDD